MYGEILLLAVASAFYPWLLLVDLIAFRAPHPERLLASFFAAGLLTTMCIDLAVVYLLQGSDLLSHSNKQDTNDVLWIAVGVLALLACFVLARGYSLPKRNKKEQPAGPGWAERMLARGAALAFVAGIVLNIFPGVFPIVGIKNIAELNLGPAGNVAAILCFNLILFMLIEVPLVGYLVAPARAAELTTDLSAWLSRNARRIGAVALGVGGAYLLVRGLAAVLVLG